MVPVAIDVFSLTSLVRVLYIAVVVQMLFSHLLLLYIERQQLQQQGNLREPHYCSLHLRQGSAPNFVALGPSIAVASDFACVRLVAWWLVLPHGGGTAEHGPDRSLLVGAVQRWLVNRPRRI